MPVSTTKFIGLTGPQLENIIIFLACTFITFIAMKVFEKCYTAWLESKTELKLKQMEIESSQLSGMKALLGQKDKAQEKAVDATINAVTEHFDNLAKGKHETVNLTDEHDIIWVGGKKP